VLSEERWKSYRDTLSASVYGDGPEARIVADWNQEMVGSVGHGIATALIKEGVRQLETFKFLSQSRQRI